MTEYITKKYIVRIHTGMLTDEQRKVVLENAAKNFYKAIQKEKENYPVRVGKSA
jgi:hypothetical protein